MSRPKSLTAVKRSTAVASAIVLAACSPDQLPTDSSLSGPPQPLFSRAGLEQFDYVQGEVIVKFRAGSSGAARGAAMQNANATARERVLTAAMRRAGDSEGLTVVHSGLGTAAAIERLRAHPDVEFAEPNFVYRHDATSNDSYYANSSLWGMYGDASSPANQYGSQAAEAWSVGNTDCSAVWVGIIDEGYFPGHEDLAANVGVNPAEASGAAGVDDDRNGYVDDVYGWDFDGNNSSVFDGTIDDHGTHVAGTIGGVGGNGKGVAGVCWSVRMINAKFLGRNGGTTINAVKAIDYMTNLKTSQGINIVATNNSWSGGGFSQSLLDAINRGGDADILFIAAAGNGGRDGVGDNNDATAVYPAGYSCTSTSRAWDCVISVASITSSGAKSGFSNFGASSVDIGAPGSGIYSTVPASSKGNAVSGYASFSGTSMATPHVSGAAALYAAYHPGSTGEQIRSAVLGSAVPTASLSGKVASNGRLNVSGF